MSNTYTFDASRRIWRRPEGIPISYSDGEEAENRLLHALRHARDVSATSPELAAAIRDWPSEYHLSLARHNLLRFLEFNPMHRILELGCGCGAITRFLGETGATVVAVEGSARRAEIAAERCRDLPNVSIYCDNLVNFQSDNKFDFVTLIGVLEYAPKFIRADDPIDACLNFSRTYLIRNGALILAIENQLGLKYFNGCTEDHTGIPYYGINNLYGKSDPITYGKLSLSRKLSNAGFRHQEFFFPFHDYKLPALILRGAALRDDRLNIADLLIHNTGRCYPENHHRAFAEDLTWQVVLENNLLADLSNSFLILAHSHESISLQTDWLGKIYSRGNRRPCFQVETTIAPDENGDLMVRKRKLFPDATGSDHEWLKHIVADSIYHSGKILAGRIHLAMTREASLAELTACFTPWMKFLLEHTVTNANGARVLPGHFIDCIPTNLIETPSGELQYFDAEWVANAPIPLAWVVTRGIIYSLRGCLTNPKLAGLTYLQLVTRIPQSSGVIITEDAIETANRCEFLLLSHCLADTPSELPFVEILSGPVADINRLSAAIDLHRELMWHKNELKRIKGTMSWQVTKPLRLAANLSLSRLLRNLF